LLKLNKYDIEFVVRRLREFAAGAGIAGPLETYVVYGASLVPQREVVKDAALVMRVLSRHRQAITVQLPFLARRIQVKSNARVFGIRSMNGLTAKVALAEQRVGLSFRRDMTARRIVEPHLSDRLRVPLIHKRDRRGARWLIEELVEDTHAGDSELMRLVAEHGGRALPR
jgi:hypothetical protein